MRETSALIESNREIVERARIAARASVVCSVIDVQPVVTGLTRTMEKIYHPRGIAIDVEAPDGSYSTGWAISRRCLYEFVVVASATMALVVCARGSVPKRRGSRYVSGRSPHWVKAENPDCPAAQREAIANSGRR